MKSLKDMVAIVRTLLMAAGSTDLHGMYINEMRNYLLSDDNIVYYVLKWDLNDWFTAGSEVPAIGKGPGRAVNNKVYEDYIVPHIATTLFGHNKDDRIMYINFENFERLSEPHIQSSNREHVRVVSNTALKEWIPRA